MLKVQNMRGSTFQKKVLHSQNFHVGHSILIHGLTQIQYVGLNWLKHRSPHVLNWRD